MTDARMQVITETLGGSPLSQAVQQRRLGLEPALQPAVPASQEEWRARIGATRARFTAAWHAALAPAMAPAAGSAADTRLSAAVRDGGVVVTTGQQAALFGGPLYTLNKALSAIALADALQEQTGVAAAPVFWAATDDADFVEAATTWAADGDGLHELALTARPPAGTIMAHAPLQHARELGEALARVCGSAPHARFLEAARDAFRDGTTIGDAYVQLLRAILEPLGMAVLDSSHAAYREAARPLLLEALRRAPEVASRVADASAAIRRAGFDPQVDDDRGLSLVFAVEEGVKRRLPLDEAARVTGQSAPPLAPNVLLRPVVERALLPTVAYVAGPGELAYFAQSNAVAAALECDAVVGVPRWSCTVIEPFAARALARLDIGHDALADVRAIEARLAREALPASVDRAMADLRARTDEGLKGLRAAVASSQLVPPAVVDGLERALRHRLDRGERRLLAAAKRRDVENRRALAAAQAACFPLGKRQERVLNFIPMLARGGDALLYAMQQQARAHADALVSRAPAPRQAEPAVR